MRGAGGAGGKPSPPWRAGASNGSPAPLASRRNGKSPSRNARSEAEPSPCSNSTRPGLSPPAARSPESISRAWRPSSRCERCDRSASRPPAPAAAGVEARNRQALNASPSAASASRSRRSALRASASTGCRPPAFASKSRAPMRPSAGDADALARLCRRQQRRARIFVRQRAAGAEAEAEKRRAEHEQQRRRPGLLQRRQGAGDDAGVGGVDVRRLQRLAGADEERLVDGARRVGLLLQLAQMHVVLVVVERSSPSSRRACAASVFSSSAARA